LFEIYIMNSKIILLLLIAQLLSLNTKAQHFTQTIRGTVIEIALDKPITGATIRIEGAKLGTVSDAEGHFKIEQVPVGTYNVIITAMGFKDNIVSQLSVNAGKEIVLTIKLEEKIVEHKEVVIKAQSKKNKPLNEMSMVSARAFTVEETQRYAASVNDPARMATNFPGVIAGDDGNNQIVIRGNSPKGMLWRMEGIDIPNPNHFAAAGSSGGGISILSTQLLANSDFVTGAFASEYGNALSGVFDLHLRKGNNEKREYTLQAGILGINAAAEGPFSKKYKGSYLINYRYSTLSLFSKIGINLTPSVTNFQDLSYNIYLPTKRFGDFTLFSFGGLSNQYFNAKKDSTKWTTRNERHSDDFVSNTGMWGITHAINIGSTTLLKTAVGYSKTNIGYNRNYMQDDYSLLDVYKVSYQINKLTLTSSLNKKINSHMLVRSGIIVNSMGFNFKENIRDVYANPLRLLVNSTGRTETFQAYSQMQYKPSEKITINAGLHYIGLAYNHSQSIEPRASIKWQVDKKQSLAFGYGKHSQIQALGIYFYQENGLKPNDQIGFSKAHHLVLSHSYAIAKNLKLKTEIYYQHLYDIPVSVLDSSTFSVLNSEGDYVREKLINKGKGRNYGLEISLEKQLSQNFYFMLSSSFYQSKYIGKDGREFNTRFNGNEIINLVTGKEFVSKNNRRTLGLNLKAVYAGGYRTTPIDQFASQQAGETIYYQDKAYSEQLPAYIRPDIRVSMKWNRKRFTSTLSLDIQNVINRQNVYDRFYNVESNTVKTYYQTGILPILNYKVEF
jgi:hypothetical protein